MKYDTDMTGVKEGGDFTPIPEGIYTLNIMQVGERVTKNNDPMFNIEYDVASGEHSGRKVWDLIVFPDINSPSIKIKGRTMHFLHCIGMPYEGELKGDTDSWLGRIVTAKIVHEEYKGKARAKVGEYILEEDDQKKTGTETETIPF